MNEDDRQDQQAETPPAESPTEGMQTEPHKPKTYKKWPPGHWNPEWVTGISTAIYAAATIVFALVAYFQLKALHATNAMTGASIALTKRTVEMAQVRERPWIAVDQVVTVLDKNPRENTVAALVIFKNFGALPADKVRARVNAKVRPATLGPSCPTEDLLLPGMTEADLERSLSVVAPGQSLSLSPLKPNATKDEMERVLSGSSFLFVYGHVEYQTPEQETVHSTKFCKRLVVAEKKAVGWTTGPDRNSMN